MEVTKKFVVEVKIATSEDVVQETGKPSRPLRK